MIRDHVTSLILFTVEKKSLLRPISHYGRLVVNPHIKCYTVKLQFEYS